MTDPLSQVQVLRIPVVAPGTPSDWKDWYHFILFDLSHDVRAFANVNLSGGGAFAEVQTTLIINLPEAMPGKREIHGMATAREWREGAVEANPLSIRTDDTQLEYRDGRFSLQINEADVALGLALEAKPRARPLMVSEGAPFGSGFMGWGLVPGLDACGEITIGDRRLSIDETWFCYQDHNFGRFRWGEDVGWEWLAAHARTADGEQITLILHVDSDRERRVGGLPYLFICVDGVLRKVYVGPSLHIHWIWGNKARLPLRLPGAMATLFADCTVREPKFIHIEAVDDRDRVDLRVTVDSFFELVVPDNRQCGHTRIGESSGTFELEMSWQSRVFHLQGLAYGEYTH